MKNLIECMYACHSKWTTSMPLLGYFGVLYSVIICNKKPKLQRITWSGIEITHTCQSRLNVNRNKMFLRLIETTLIDLSREVSTSTGGLMKLDGAQEFGPTIQFFAIEQFLEPPNLTFSSFQTNSNLEDSSPFYETTKTNLI